MATLTARLNALAKRAAKLDPSDPAVLYIAAALDEIDKLLPPVRRGRPKQRDLVLHLLRFYVDGIKALPDSGVTTDKGALQRLLRKHKGRFSLKALQNRLARARKLIK